MEDITVFFTQLIEQSKSLDIAEAEFKRLLAGDADLQHEYSEWCQAVGSSERRGFRDLGEEYMESQDNIWNHLTDYDEQDS